MKPLLLFLCVLVLVSAAMLHSALVRESWPVTVIYRIPQEPVGRDALIAPSYGNEPVEHDALGNEPAERDAPGAPDDVPTFPLNLNGATREELMHIPGIGEVLSGRIVQYRDHIGGYTELSQLTGIYGISQNTLERIGGYLTIGPY
jgi:competence ComEA-like helix-hairpin-helix protein